MIRKERYVPTNFKTANEIKTNEKKFIDKKENTSKDKVIKTMENKNKAKHNNQNFDTLFMLAVCSLLFHQK